MLILRLMLLSVFGLSIGAASSALAQNVYWGGVSFSGWEAKDSLYPNVASYLCRAESCAVDSIDGWALTAVGNAKFDQFSVSMDYISGGAVEGVIMTPMITGESFAMVEDVTGG